MRAITVVPGKRDSVALTDMPEPPAEDGPVLVQTQAIGICGTDLEIINGEYGSTPPGQDRLIIGHESLGRVAEAAPGTGFRTGDLVVGIVRRRDPVPCPACAAGHWDMCINGGYTERGIKDRHGYASERYRIHPEYLVAVDPALGLLGVLLEPTTVVAKAWDHIERIGRRAAWAPQAVLVTGAGPIGLLAALLAVQRGYQTYVLDRVTEGRKPEMVRRLGATYVNSGDAIEAAAEATSSSNAPASSSCYWGPDRGIPATGSSASPEFPRSAPNRSSTPACSTGTWSCRTRSCSARSTPTGSTTNWLPRRWPRPTPVARRPDHPPGAAEPVGRRLRAPARRHQDCLGLPRRVTLAVSAGPTPGLPARW